MDRRRQGTVLPGPKPFDLAAGFVERATQRAETRVLSELDRAAESLITGLRLVEGVDAAVIAGRYGVDVLGRWGVALAPHADAGRLVVEGTRLRLTRSGMLLANDVLSVFV